MRIDETYFSSSETQDNDDNYENIKEDSFNYPLLAKQYDFVFMMHMLTSRVFPPEKYQLPDRLSTILEMLPSVREASEIYLLYGYDPFPPLNTLKRGKRNFYYKSFDSDEAPNDIRLFFGINAKFRNYASVWKTMKTLSDQVNGSKVNFYLAAAHGNIIYHPDADMSQVPRFIDIDSEYYDVDKETFYNLLLADNDEFSELIKQFNVL